MSTKTIPAQVITICDGCNVQMDLNNSKRSASMTIKAANLDFQGAPCGGGVHKVDLCDSCFYKVSKAIDAAIVPTGASA